MPKQIKTSELTGAALDWAVAGCEGAAGQSDVIPWFKPSTDWSQGGPIIERERLHIIPLVAAPAGYAWECSTLIPDDGPGVWRRGPTSLIAAMRCYVASKLGDTVEVPDEMLS